MSLSKEIREKEVEVLRYQSSISTSIKKTHRTRK